ncbi:hypothetical protein [Streptomyces sp. IBSBF 2435]|uniref:hypothetical protein n=1 Tax=Streptomyces sp. IBSBF 2435 TaxID=2903531 RepID=UPI002FDBECDF
MHIAWHICHGVDTEQALTLRASGITSRRIAHLRGRDAARLGHRAAGLRQWTPDPGGSRIPESGLDGTRMV